MKTYEKPRVYFEKFELSQNIAVCDYTLDAADVNACKIVKDNFEDDGEDFTGGFTDKNLCTVPVSVYCYTDGSGTLPSVFQS